MTSVVKRPMKAEDWDATKQKYPVIAMPKIDGVRALNVAGKLYGRSMKQHANVHTTAFFSDLALSGFDGELVAASPTHPNLVSLTTSAVNTIKGEPHLVWWLFDYTQDDLQGATYQKRLEALEVKIIQLRAKPRWNDALRMVPYHIVHNEQELKDLETYWLDLGYEGVILRDPEGAYKQGRSTVKEGGFLRIKQFVIEEALVVGIEEGMINTNVATSDELGYTTRSSHKENMVPSGQVGALRCVDLKTGRLIKVSPGKMKHDDRQAYFTEPEALLWQVVKYKHFLKGVKDKPRFPTFETLRAISDLDPQLIALVNHYKAVLGATTCKS